MDILLWLAGLFASAFLSATVLPGNSEAALLAALHFKPSLGLLAVAVASLGNILGGMLTVWMGRKLPSAPQKPWLQKLQKLGPISLLMSWLPIVGDAACGLAGWLRWPWWSVLVYLSIGKIARYVAIYVLFNW